MDREISVEERRIDRRRKLIKALAVIVGVAVAAVVLVSLFRGSVKRSDLTVAVAEHGVLEVSVTASGKVVPAFEEVINSPIDTRIDEVYGKGGDMVEEGTPLLGLDLTSAQTEYDKLHDQYMMQQYQLDQLRLNNATYIDDLEMRIRVKEMAVSRLEVELRNECYLDSLGSGTGDNVHRARLAYNTGRLELEQLRQQLVNERKVKDADVRVKQLELQISEKNLAEMKRTLADARILSPRRGVLTYINNQNGAQVARGTHVATVSDLSRFKVECEIADSYADRVATGGIAKIKTGRKVVGGTVGNVTPLSRNGVISFTVLLDDDSDPAMRSGLKTDVYVMCTVVNDATMIPNGSYYSGAGEYDMFVMVSDNELVRRRISLGASSYDKVEVTAGLQPGERIVISDLGRLKKNSKLKIR